MSNLTTRVEPVPHGVRLILGGGTKSMDLSLSAARELSRDLDQCATLGLRREGVLPAQPTHVNPQPPRLPGGDVA